MQRASSLLDGACSTKPGGAAWIACIGKGVGNEAVKTSSEYPKDLILV